MSVGSRFSSFFKKNFSMSNWMDVDGVKHNTRRVGGLFKELQQLSSKKSFDKNLSFDSWCAKNKISEKELSAYRHKVLAYLVGYVVLFLLLVAYMVYFIISSRYLVSLYMILLAASVALYSFKQYMVWALLKMHKLHCSFKELMAWTFSRKS